MEKKKIHILEIYFFIIYGRSPTSTKLPFTWESEWILALQISL